MQHGRIHPVDCTDDSVTTAGDHLGTKRAAVTPGATGDSQVGRGGGGGDRFLAWDQALPPLPPQHLTASGSINKARFVPRECRRGSLLRI